MSEQIKNYGKSIRTKLLNVAKAENAFYQTILTRYFQERLLFRLSKSQYKDNFYLKGGALMYAYEHFAARPTLDIDFLGSNISNNGKRIVNTFKEICSVPCEEDGVNYDIEHIAFKPITEFRDYHGIRLNIPVSMDTISQVMTMDIGFGDIVTPGPIELDYPLLVNGLPQANILAYSIETVIAEKMHAVIDLAEQNSRMKDYYDLYTILHGHHFNEGVLKEAVRETFAHRHTLYVEETAFFREDFPEDKQMQTKWRAFIRKIASHTNLTFAEVTLYLQNQLEPYWNSLKDAG
jgi:predicted nucleotidyltransferase component of viral defense system